MKTILIALALCSATASFAQIEKGRSYLTGQIGGSSSNTTYDTPSNSGIEKQRAYNVSAGYGYLLAGKWAVGLSFNASGNKALYNNNTRDQSMGYGISPYVRRYFSIAEKFYVYLDGGLGYTQTKSTFKVPGNTTDTHIKAASVFITPGVTYFLSDRFALNASFGSLYFRNSKVTGTSQAGYHQKDFYANFALNAIGFGASVFF
ncbi:MAG TPA: outer membrane beta-barrel protein [Cyclobacteriaceae bacterium]